jgi:hypothetical protein
MCRENLKTLEENMPLMKLFHKKSPNRLLWDVNETSVLRR